MTILTLKTNISEITIGLYEDLLKVDIFKLKNSKDLSKHLLASIEKILISNNLKFTDLEGINCYQGPGGFSSIRIVIVTALSLSYALDINLVGSSNKTWIKDGNKRLLLNQSDSFIEPIYSSTLNLTEPKK